MARLCSCRLLLCVSVLEAFLLAAPALADETKRFANCTAPEVQDDQEEPECCVPNLMKEGAEGKECAERPSAMSVAVAITLILSFTFLISLQYFMNHSDEDMREYAYKVISSTVSIFSAVLTFQSLNGLVEDLISEPLQERFGVHSRIDLAVNLAHMLFWYAATQVTIAFASKALKSEEWRREELEEARNPDAHVRATSKNEGHDHGHTNVMLEIEINSVCYGMVLAHLTGFASIKFWTELQQTDRFNGSPLRTLLPIPIALLAQLFFERVTSLCRAIYIAFKGDKDWFEKTWDEKCQHAEDDILGLTLSVMIVNSLRYAINESFGHHCWPNSEQKEEGTGCEFERTFTEACWLFGFGVLFVVLLFLTKLLFIKLSEESDSVEAQESNRIKMLVLGDGTEEIEESKPCCAVFIERMEDVILTVWAMAHAWCIFHGTRELMMTLNPSFLGKEENSTTLAVVLASGVTYVALIIVRILDLIADLPEEWTPHEVDDAIKTVVGGSSIFIGFAWEQTFDASVDELAESTRFYSGPHAPAVAKLVIGSACIGVVFFAWKMYILPFVFKKGWRYGYVFSRNDLKQRCHELATHDKQFNIDHLHQMAQTLSEVSDNHKLRFTHNNENYKSLPCTEIEAMQTEILEWKTHARYLEEQLAEERKAGAEWKIHRRFLEKQLAEARSDAKTRCEASGIEFPTGHSGEEAAREYLIEFLERQLEEKKGKANRVVSVESGSSLSTDEGGIKSILSASSDLGDPSFPELKKTTKHRKTRSERVRFSEAVEETSFQTVPSEWSSPPKFVKPSFAEAFKRSSENNGQDYAFGEPSSYVRELQNIASTLHQLKATEQAPDFLRQRA